MYLSNRGFFTHWTNLIWPQKSFIYKISFTFSDSVNWVTLKKCPRYYQGHFCLQLLTEELCGHQTTSRKAGVVRISFGSVPFIVKHKKMQTEHDSKEESKQIFKTLPFYHFILFFTVQTLSCSSVFYVLFIG